MEKDFEAKVVKYSTPTENSYVHYNIGTYTTTPGGGKMYIASSYVTYYGNKTDANGRKITEAEKPEVDDIVIVNGVELRINNVSWYSGYYYLKLYPNDNTPADYKENFSSDYSGERLWIEFL